MINNFYHDIASYSDVDLTKAIKSPYHSFDHQLLLIAEYTKRKHEIATEVESLLPIS
jgi:hypothetical protein